MSGFLGIDHPLVAVRDLEAARSRCAAIGFAMTPITRHPWGTETSVAVFERCLLELVGVADETLLDAKAVGGFAFGRTVRDHVEEREGISLTALHSEDADGDAAVLAARGVTSQGTIAFGRDIVLPDGRPDRTATTLRIVADPNLPRFSHFLCQQRRPDLIYVPRWMEHPNTAYGLAEVAVLADAAGQVRVRRRLEAIYGKDAVREQPRTFSVRTGNGRYVVGDADAMTARYGRLPAALTEAREPCSIAIHVRVRSLAAALEHAAAAGFAPRSRTGAEAVMEPEFLGNTFLVFEER